MTNLSPREAEICDLLGDGLRTLAIGKKLFISGKTVQSHIQNVKDKYDFDTTWDLAVYMVRRKAFDTGKVKELEDVIRQAKAILDTVVT